MRGDTTMAEGHRMTAADVVAKVMAGEHGDFVREAVALIAHELALSGDQQLDLADPCLPGPWAVAVSVRRALAAPVLGGPVRAACRRSGV
jgi:hypothetical protein